jgi:hypothetical protein
MRDAARTRRLAIDSRRKLETAVADKARTPPANSVTATRDSTRENADLD